MSEDILQQIPDAEDLAMAVPPGDLLTEEQLQQRHDLVELHRRTEESGSQSFYRHSTAMEYEFEGLSAEEIRSKIQEEREAFEKHGYKSQLLREYDEYLEDLREVRRGQRAHLQEVAEKTKDLPAEERREAFIEALSFSPEIASRVLKKVTTTGVEPKVRESLLESGPKTKESFTQAMTQLAIESPKKIIDSYDLFIKTAEVEQLKPALLAHARVEPGAMILFDQYKRVLELPNLTEDEGKEFIAGLVDDNSDNPEVIRILPIAIERGVIDPDQSREIAEKALLQSTEIPYPSVLENAIEDGLIERSVVAQKNLALTQEDCLDYRVNDLYDSSILNEQEKALVHSIVARKLQTLDASKINVIESSKILSEDEKKEVIAELFAKSPLQCLDESFTGMQKMFGEERVAAVLRTALATNDPMLRSSNMLSFAVLGTDIFDEDERRHFASGIIEDDPAQVFELVSSNNLIGGDFFNKVDLLKDIYSSEEIKQLLLEAIDATEKIPVTDLDKWISYIGGPDEQRDFLSNYIETHGSFNKVKDLFVCSDTARSLFTKEEIAVLVEESFMQVIESDEDIASRLYGMKELIELVGKQKPESW